MKIGSRVAPLDVIKMSDFCVKIIKEFQMHRGSESQFFLIHFAGHRYNSNTTCDYNQLRFLLVLHVALLSVLC